MKHLVGSFSDAKGYVIPFNNAIFQHYKIIRYSYSEECVRNSSYQVHTSINMFGYLRGDPFCLL